MTISVYRIINKVNGKSYVGITSNNLKARWNDHVKGYFKSVIHYALKKYGKRSFSFVLLDVAETWEEACEKEKFYIKEFRSKVPYGYNLTDGGDGVLGLDSWNKGGTISEAIRKKISESLKGRFPSEKNPFYGKSHSDEARKKISVSCCAAMTEKRKKQISEEQKGQIRGPHSEITKEKLRQANLGKVVSEETRRKLSESHKGQVAWNKGASHSEETKKRMSESHKGHTYNRGRIFSEEHKRKLSESHMGNQNHLGHVHSEETKKRIAEKKRGCIHTKETKRKMSESHRGFKHTEESRQKIRDSWIIRKMKINEKGVSL